MKKSTKVFNQMIMEELNRELKQADGQLVQVSRRLIQVIEHAGLEKKDIRAAEKALKFHQAASAKAEEEDRELRELAFEYKAHYTELFAKYKAVGLPPPDRLPHPAHVNIVNEGVRIFGPVTSEQRKWWEFLKLYIQDIAESCAISREEIRADPEDIKARKCLEYYERSRRKLMRKVPKGWNWKENIWTLDSDLEELVAWATRNRAEKLRG